MSITIQLPIISWDPNSHSVHIIRSKIKKLISHYNHLNIINVINSPIPFGMTLCSFNRVQLWLRPKYMWMLPCSPLLRRWMLMLRLLLWRWMSRLPEPLHHKTLLNLLEPWYQKTHANAALLARVVAPKKKRCSTC